MQSPDEYITITEAAALLKVNRVTVWRRVKSGELPSYRSDADRRMTLVRRADIDALKLPKRIMHTKTGTGN